MLNLILKFTFNFYIYGFNVSSFQYFIAKYVTTPKPIVNVTYQLALDESRLSNIYKNNLM